MNILQKALLLLCAVVLINFVGMNNVMCMDNNNILTERYYINDKINVKYPEFIVNDQKIGLEKVNNKVRSVADKFIKDMLKDALGDVDVILASNGLEGLEHYRKNKNIALIITDIKMPIMSGHTMAGQIRVIEEFTNICIVKVVN